MWSTGEGNGKPLLYFSLRTQEQYENTKDVTLKDELPRSVGAQYATGDEWRNNSRKNEGMEPKQKQYPVEDVTTGDRSKVQCCKEQYCIGTWNVRSMNQSKLEVVPLEKGMASHSSILAWRIPWTEEPGRLQSRNHKESDMTEAT